MDARATAIIAVSHQACGHTGGMVLHNVERTVAQCLESGLDALVVAPQAALNAWQGWRPPAGASTVSLPTCSPRQLLGVSLRAGVQMSPKACGWFLVPSDLVLRQPSTLPHLREALRHHLIVQATVGQQARLPVGFDRELFSELIHLDSDHALHRLMNRYPTQPVEVDEPGWLMQPWRPEPTPWRGGRATPGHPDA